MQQLDIFIIYGPPACGKTTNKERFLNHYRNYGYKAIYEEAEFSNGTDTMYLNHIILLSSRTLEELTADEALLALGVRFKSFEQAMEDTLSPTTAR